MSASRTTPAPPSDGKWISRLNGLVTTILALGVIGAVLGLVNTAAMALPWPNAYGFRGLWAPDARVLLDGVVQPGVRQVDATISLTLNDPEHAPLLAVLQLFTWVPGTATVLAVLFLLQRITAAGVAGDRLLFSAETVVRLRRIGTILMIGSAGAFVLDFAARTVAAHMLMVHASAVPGMIEPPVLALMMGMGAFVVAEVVRRGLVMLDELEGTI
ncbi:hypothetical protein [Microbispora sp. NPDC049125]|uniref:hypothetical protein n=1 Tax=Microbispora sp. NPDC049125 TaxID=3154929 RepID=UPI003465D702